MFTSHLRSIDHINNRLPPYATVHRSYSEHSHLYSGGFAQWQISDTNVQDNYVVSDPRTNNTIEDCNRSLILLVILSVICVTFSRCPTNIYSHVYYFYLMNYDVTYHPLSLASHIN